MSHSVENIERTRQAIMRLRELLDILQARLHDSEHSYTRLFTQLTAEQHLLPEKERQRLAALSALDAPNALQTLALHLQFQMHEFEGEFEQVYNHIYDLNSSTGVE